MIQGDDDDIIEYCECEKPSSVTGAWDEWGYKWQVCLTCGEEIDGSREYKGDGDPNDAPWDE